MTNSQLKKQEIEERIQAIEQRFDNKFQATKETIELGRSPQKLVSKRPFGSLLITFGLGLIAGRVARAASTRKNSPPIPTIIAYRNIPMTLVISRKEEDW
jgi:hypothetical protein